MEYARLGTLLMLLLMAAGSDWRWHRIPNWLVLAGAVNGVAWTILPSNGPDLLASLEGFAVGLALLLPMYLVRAMAAGDVKLMAMVGTFLGPLNTVGAGFCVFMAGGILAVLVALNGRVFARMCRNIGQVITGSVARLASGSLPTAEIATPAARMPYALAVAVGTTGFLAWLRT